MMQGQAGHRDVSAYHDPRALGNRGNDSTEDRIGFVLSRCTSPEEADKTDESQIVLHMMLHY